MPSWISQGRGTFSHCSLVQRGTATFLSELLLPLDTWRGNMCTGVWGRLWEKVWNNLKCLKRCEFQFIKSLKMGFVKSKKVLNQIQIWTLTSMCVIYSKLYIYILYIFTCNVIFFYNEFYLQVKNFHYSDISNSNLQLGLNTPYSQAYVARCFNFLTKQ